MVVATKVELTNNTGFPRRYTVADATAISKGTFLTLLDPRTASGANTPMLACAGIASMDKEASDGSTSISCWTDGIFECYCSGTINVGAPVAVCSSPVGFENYVMQATNVTASGSGAVIIGYALETASAGEVINVRVRL